jgi:glycosyltransferase involved in cell wall biosynthesis
VNVLFLDQFSALGGAQQCLLDLIPAVEERGWNARAAIPYGGPMVELLRKRGVHVDEIRSGAYRCGKKSAGDLLQFAVDVPWQAAAIGDLIGTARIDLLYVNGPRVLIAAALAARGRIPVLFHAHHRIEQTTARFLEGLALRRSATIAVACCDAVAEPLRNWIPRHAVHTVANGTSDLGFFQRGFQWHREPRIGVIGRIAREKGQADFLRAAAILLRTAPRARFVVCGAPLFGDRAYDDEVRQLGSGLPVEFLAWQEDVGAVMRGLDVLVIPSKQEGMPRVLLEAFSSGLPVAAFRVGGIPEVIEPERTGFLTRGATPADLAATLREALESDPNKLRGIARTARQQWERLYTLEAYREGITNLMTQFVPRADPGRATPRSRRSTTLP